METCECKAREYLRVASRMLHLSGAVLGRNLISVLVLTSYTNDSNLLGSTLFYSLKLFLFGYTYYKTTKLYRIYWPGYPSKCLQSGVYTYVKHTGHEMRDKVATIARATHWLQEQLSVYLAGFWLTVSVIFSWLLAVGYTAPACFSRLHTEL